MKTQSKEKIVIFTPDNEPYLGEPMLHQFDIMISQFAKQNTLVAEYTRINTNSLTDIEQAGCVLIPAAFSLLLSARELLRQGYVYGAAVLLRPIVERVAVLSYLCDKPTSLEVWKKGWEYKKRPKFTQLIDNLAKNTEQQGKNEFIYILNSLVHGGEDSLSFGALGGDLSCSGFSSGKVTNNPKKCNDVALISTMMLVILLARTNQVFPTITSD